MAADFADDICCTLCPVVDQAIDKERGDGHDQRQAADYDEFYAH
jgi:hypothetical protein